MVALGRGAGVGIITRGQLYDYNGQWRMIPLGVAAVGGFVAIVDNRRNRKTDELTTLNLTAR